MLMPGKTQHRPCEISLPPQTGLNSPSLAEAAEGLTDAGQLLWVAESQLCLQPMLTSTTGEKNSSQCHEQNPMQSILWLLHEKAFGLWAGAHSIARRSSPAWSQQPLASDSKESTKCSKAHASTLAASLRSLYGTNQPEVTQTTLKICKSLPIMIIQKGSWHQNPLPSPPV